MKIQGKVYLVGGAVRDIMLGVDPKDRDYVVVGGSQENLLSLGFKQVGADFPVFLHPETGEEYALARVERKSGLGYNGFTVETKGVCLTDDLARRDFTINAMAMDGENVYDPFGGISDIRAGIIRHVGSAFKDDPLRALRAARFAARYDFYIAQSTQEEILKIPREDLEAIPRERVFIEIRKAISDGNFGDFVNLLRFLKIEWVIENVMGSLFGAIYTKNIDDLDVDAYLLRVLIDTQSKTDFEALQNHAKIAKIWNNYVKSDRSAADLYQLINAIGKKDSHNFKLLAKAHKIVKLNYAVLLMKAAYFAFHSVTSATVLSVDPTLSGPALGAAIKAARIAAIEELMKD